MWARRLVVIAHATTSSSLPQPDSPVGGSDVADTPVGSFTVERKISGDQHAPLGTLRNSL
jgi:hypothetical protein